MPAASYEVFKQKSVQNMAWSKVKSANKKKTEKCMKDHKIASRKKTT